MSKFFSVDKAAGACMCYFHDGLENNYKVNKELKKKKKKKAILFLAILFLIFTFHIQSRVADSWKQ